MAGILLPVEIEVDGVDKCNIERNAVNGWWWTEEVVDAADMESGAFGDTIKVHGATTGGGASSDTVAIGFLGDP